MTPTCDLSIVRKFLDDERSGGLATLCDGQRRQRALDAIAAAKRALSEGKAVDLVDVNRAYQILYGNEARAGR